MSFVIKFCLCFIVCVSTFAADVTIEQMDIELSADSEPQLTIAGCVNVATGHYFHTETDLLGNTIDPISLQRYFDSGSTRETFMGTGFGCQFPFMASHIQKSPNHTYAMISERDGFLLPYRGKCYDKTHICKIDPRVIKKGCTNLTKLTSNAHDNFVNWSAIFHSKKENWILTKGDGTKRIYENPLLLEKVKRYQIEMPTEKIYLLSEEVKPNGNKLQFEYLNVNGKPRISRIRTLNRTGKAVLNEVNFEYTTHSCVARSSCGNKVEYTQEKKNIYIAALENNLEKIYLAAVTSSQYGNQSFKIKANSYFSPLKRVDYPHHRFLEINYDSKRRVESILEPDINGHPVKTYSFEYLKDGTKAFDAQGNLTHYFFDKDKRLLKKQLYDGNSFVRQETFTWSQEEDKLGWLESKSIQCNDHILQVQSYVYDGKGNVVRKMIYGNLTGEKSNNEFQNLSQADCYVLYYEYSKDDLNLLVSQSNPQGLKHIYKYLPGTNLKTHEYELYHDVIQKRIFITYDENGEVKTLSEDDGNNFLEKDNSGVTFKKITTILTEKKPSLVCFGKPIEIVESVMDCSSGKVHVKNRVKIAYDNFGYECKRSVYDSKNVFCYDTFKEYDSRGNLVLETNPLKQSIRYAYNQNNQIIEKETLGSGKITFYFYDCSKRLSKKEDQYANGEVRKTTYVYNSLNQLVSEYDIYANETKYVYDGLGRNIQTIKPSIFNNSGDIITPKIFRKFNALDQIVEEIDENHNITRYLYTLYGKPTEILHPDNAVEKFTYFPCGWLKQHWKPDGSLIRYKYNPKGNLVCKEYLDPQSVVIKKEEYTYKGDLLTSKKDAAGTITTFSYDCAGQLMTETIDGSQIIHYAYDDFGRKIKAYQLSDAQEVYCEAFEYDWLNRITRKTIQDGNLNIYRREEFEYDFLGNCILKKSYHSLDKIAHYLAQYDSDGRRVFQENPLSYQIKWEYNHQFMNRFGQCVLLITKTDSFGRQTLEEHDSQNRIIKREFFDKGILMSKTSYTYDAKGNLTSEEATVIENGKPKNTYPVSWTFNHNGQVTSEAEFPEGRRTAFIYDKQGQLIKKTLPNGIEINFDYDYLGRNIRLYSSDQTVDYTLCYDLNDNLIEVFNHVNNLEQHRFYDQFNRLTREEISSGISISYVYDNFDRISRVILPNKSSIVYTYDIYHLIKVERLSSSGKKTYECSCESYDQIGNLLEEITPTGKNHYHYDLLGRLIDIQTPFWKSALNEFDSEGKVISVSQEDPLGRPCNKFAYDAYNHLCTEQNIVSNTYCYDSLGNCVKKNESLQRVNTQNQLLLDETSSYEYDVNGNLIYESNPETFYKYDALNRLISRKSLGNTTSFTYDVFGRCIQIKNNEVIKNLIYQGDREIGSFQNGKLFELRLLHPNPNNEKTFAIEVNDKTFFPVQDHFYNVCALQNIDSLAQWYRYSAFGEIEVHGETSIENPWLFANRRNVCGLYLFTHRFYNPKIRRWQTVDPIGYQDGLNLYTYVHNNPLYYQDPNGQFAFVIPLVLGAMGTGGFTIALPSMGCIAGAIAGATLGFVVYNIDNWYDTTYNQVTTEEEAQTESEQKVSGKNPNWKPPRTEPNSLEEKLTMDEAKSIKDKERKGIMENDRDKWDDSNYDFLEWKKCQHVHYPLDSKSNNITIHWWQHRATGATHGYKFKDNK